MKNKYFYLMMILSMIFWGASWVNVKFLSNYINAYEVIFFRMGISIIAMFPVLIYLKQDFRLSLKSIALILLASLILVFYSIVFFLGVKNGTAGLGGALVTTLIPINTFLILALWHKKVISLKHSFALILGAFGVLTMLNIWQFNLSEIFAIHNIYFLLASILWPLLTITSSKESKVSPFVFTFYVYLITTIIVYSLFIDSNIFTKVLEFDYIFWINVGAISLLATAFATSTYFIGVEKLGTKKVSSFVFLVPTSALILSAIFLGEIITFTTLIGTICTIISIYILNDIKLKSITSF